MNRLFTFLILLFFSVISLYSQATLEGVISDKETGSPLDFAYIKLYKGTNLVTGTQTDADGNYVISHIDNGTYDVEASYLGYTSEKKTGVVLGAGKVTRINFKLSVQGIQLTELVITEYKAPLVDIDNTTTGATVTAEKIQSLPTKSVNAIAATTAGVASVDGGAINIRGGRTNATAYYVDGVRVMGLIPQSEIEQMQVITGGLEARYGDATGGLISLTTKGPSQVFSGGIELETSQYLDPYGYNLASAFVSGPIIKKKGQSILGFRIAYQYNGVKDDSPSAIGHIRMPASVIEDLEKKPVIDYKGTRVAKGIFLTNKDLGGKLDAAPNEESRGSDINVKLDARLSKNLDVAITGSYNDDVNRFTPSKAWSLLNYNNNPFAYGNSYRINFRLRHKIGKQGIDMGQDNTKSTGSLIRNAYYNLNAAYEKSEGNSEDYRHKQNLFNYGYYGSQDMSLVEVVTIIDPETWKGSGTQFIGGNYWDFVGYNRRFGEFLPNKEINPVLANFNDINGYLDNNFNRLWDDMYSNVGQIYNSVAKNESERYNFSLNAGFDFLLSGSKRGRHSIELGVIGEMRVDRSWGLNPLSLWELAHEQQNLWIVGVDTTDIIGTFTTDLGGIERTWQRYNTKLNRNDDSKFYKEIRTLLGKGEHDYVSVDEEVTPDQLRLDMFSGKELNDKRIVGYYGYDYLGNKLSNDVKFTDFFTGQGKQDFWSPAYNPLYGAVYIQDKFSFKDIIMRVGARIDYFDANTKVLKDPYALYEIENARDFYQKNTQYVRPASIEDDYKVYVSDAESSKVIGFRKDDSWFLPNGTATDGSLIFKGGLVYPYFKERDVLLRNIQAKDYNPNISFEDYKPQVNFMPRIAFSFPISENAGFFAHYDVLVQRPGAGEVIMTPMDYYYFESSGSGTYNNPNLKPEKTIDYEVGFQQKLSSNSALKIQTYYREQRDMIRIRPYFFVPSVSQYYSYGNLDYGTVKGFSFTYDFRRKTNLEFQVAYTLQFANGTGSDANSAAGLSNKGIIRNLYATNFDERHRLAGIVDFRYFEGKLYNGPVLFGKNILQNAGLNMQINAVSGRPYTQSSLPEAFGGSGFEGSINGSRKPWYFEVGMKIDKMIKITSRLQANIYLRAENLLNTKNVVGVYSYTGDPDDDGFLLSQWGQNRIEKIIDQGKPIEGFKDMYSWYVQNRGNYSRPRRIYFGVVFNL